MAFSREGIQEVLSKMFVSAGGIGILRDVDFNFILPDQNAAEEFCKSAESIGCKAESQFISDEFGKDWEAKATRFMNPTYENIVNLGEELTRMAEALGGENDGWGCFSG